MTTTRERLIETMSAHMRKRGYGSSVVQEVLDDADVTAGSMYHHFPDGKESVAAAAIREAGMAANELMKAGSEKMTVADTVTAFFTSISEEMVALDFAYGCAVGVPTSEAGHAVEPIRKAGAEVFAAWLETTAANLRAEGWSELGARNAARLIISTYEGSTLLARALRDVSVIESALAELLTYLEAGEPAR